MAHQSKFYTVILYLGLAVISLCVLPEIQADINAETAYQLALIHTRALYLDKVILDKSVQPESATVAEFQWLSDSIKNRSINSEEASGYWTSHFKPEKTKQLLLVGLIMISILGTKQLALAQDNDPFLIKRQMMVEGQIAKRGIHDKRALAAMQKVERHLFVPTDLQKYAYEDYPLSIGYNQTISQPYIVAYMTQAANLKNTDKVLEIGTGSGYQTALLAELAKEVYSIELIDALAKTAEKRLQDLGYKNIFIKQGDGYRGWDNQAPFDVIIVTASPENIPQKFIDQLKIGGRMVIPIGSFFQELYLMTKKEGTVDKTKLLPVQFVPMVKPKQ